METSYQDTHDEWHHVSVYFSVSFGRDSLKFIYFYFVYMYVHMFVNQMHCLWLHRQDGVLDPQEMELQENRNCITNAGK